VSRTACTESQCMYKGALYLYFTLKPAGLQVSFKSIGVIRFKSISFDMIYLTAIWLTPGGSSTVHIYTQKIHRTIQLTQIMDPTTQLIGKSAGRASSL